MLVVDGPYAVSRMFVLEAIMPSKIVIEVTSFEPSLLEGQLWEYKLSLRHAGATRFRTGIGGRFIEGEGEINMTLFRKVVVAHVRHYSSSTRVYVIDGQQQINPPGEGKRRTPWF